ncbi:MAG: glyoxalase/bleomycin resistance/extradiol dioxygenase family protein [Bryobacterales bacterium]|nr:glyoxalase/bleomycin resistance/extradiol dioxygenase family protein [Bryobacterales bacterium]
MPITNLNPYVNYLGQAADAIALYSAALGAKTEALMRWADLPPQQGEGCQGAPAAPNPEHILHAELRIGDRSLMVSDAPGGQHPSPAESNISIAINYSDLDEAQRAFAALTANGGKVVMPIADSFWGASFGIAMDPFGVTWLFNCPKK